MRSKRRLAKRAGLVLTVGLAVLWVASARWGAAVLAYPAGCVGVYAGFVRVGWDAPWEAEVDEWWFQRPARHHLPFRWWVQTHEVGFGAVGGGGRVAYEVPLWMLVVAAGGRRCCCSGSTGRARGGAAPAGTTCGG